MAQHGGTIRFENFSIPFVRLGKNDFILFDSLISKIQPSKKVLSVLRRRAVIAESNEIEFLRLVQIYQQKTFEDDEILLKSNDEQLLIGVNEISQQIEEFQFVYETNFNEFQQKQHEKLLDELPSNFRKTTKRKINGTMTELKNLRMCNEKISSIK